MCRGERGVAEVSTRRPVKAATTRRAWLDKAFHEDDLIKAGLEEEPREGSQGLLAQMAAPIEIAAALQIAGSKVALVVSDTSGKASCDGPHATGIKCFKQRGMRD